MPEPQTLLPNLGAYGLKRTPGPEPRISDTPGFTKTQELIDTRTFRSCHSGDFPRKVSGKVEAGLFQGLRFSVSSLLDTEGEVLGYWSVEGETSVRGLHERQQPVRRR